MLLFYKLLKLVIQRKLFFNLLFNKIKSQKNIDKNSLTHQEIMSLLNKKDRVKMYEIFDIYEKVFFTKHYNLKIKYFFHFNYKIIKFCFLNR